MKFLFCLKIKLIGFENLARVKAWNDGGKTGGRGTCSRRSEESVYARTGGESEMNRDGDCKSITMRNDATLLFFVACLLPGRALARAGRLLTAWRSGKMADWGREVAGSIPALNIMLPRLWFVLAWTITLCCVPRGERTPAKRAAPMRSRTREMGSEREMQRSMRGASGSGLRRSKPRSRVSRSLRSPAKLVQHSRIRTQRVARSRA